MVSGGKCIVNITNIPTLNGSNYLVRREKYELKLALGEVKMNLTLISLLESVIMLR
jgi:hypothetical protein